MRNKRAREKASGAGVLTSSPLPPFVPSLMPELCPPSFHLPEWQLAAGRVRWARQPPSLHTFANGLAKTHPCACGIAIFGRLWPHRALITAPRSMAAIKTCNSTSTENESSGKHSGTRPHHKIKHLSRGPFSRSLKNNYMWTDSKFWWTFPIRKIKTDKNGVASVLAPVCVVGFTNIKDPQKLTPVGLSSNAKCRSIKCRTMSFWESLKLLYLKSKLGLD